MHVRVAYILSLVLIFLNILYVCFFFLFSVFFNVDSGGFLHNRLATLLRTGVGRFGSCSYKRSMVSTVACECGAEEQTVDHVVLLCLIPRPPQRPHALRFWMMRQSNGCSTFAPRSSTAKQWFEELAQREEEETGNCFSATFHQQISLNRHILDHSKYSSATELLGSMEEAISK